MAARDAIRRHWPEYAMEAAGLGLFMVAAGVVTTLVESPDWPVRQAVEDPLLRRAVIGLAMGLTAVALIHSPWGQRSGAHLNPAVTLAFWRLGKVATWDAVFYAVSQTAGGVVGVLLVAFLLGERFTAPPISYVATLPGREGAAVAWLAEAAISFVLMLTVLAASNSARFMRFTGVFAGTLVALYIGFEAPLSGMSMNPARTLASALPGGLYMGLWIYLTAPPLGMLAAVQTRRALRLTVRCAKLDHHSHRRCIFRCGHAAEPQATALAPEGEHPAGRMPANA